MQIKDAIKLAEAKCKSSPTANLDVKVILCKTLSFSHEQLLLSYNQALSEQEKRKFFELLERRLSFEPIAYITGSQEFYSRDFFVNKNVLIPRPETELLINVIIEDYQHNTDKEIKILDLGTGSGIIAITLAKEISSAVITAIDISDKALDVAKLNAYNHQVDDRIKFANSDWFSNIFEFDFDYIVSNPPYIGFDDKNYMSPSTILFEPKIALYAKKNGLEAYNSIISSASFYLKANGKVFFEIGFLQKDEVVALLKDYNFMDIIVKKDLANHDRVVMGTKI